MVHMSWTDRQELKPQMLLLSFVFSCDNSSRYSTLRGDYRTQLSPTQSHDRFYFWQQQSRSPWYEGVTSAVRSPIQFWQWVQSALFGMSFTHEWWNCEGTWFSAFAHQWAVLLPRHLRVCSRQQLLVLLQAAAPPNVHLPCFWSHIWL